MDTGFAIGIGIFYFICIALGVVVGREGGYHGCRELPYQRCIERAAYLGDVELAKRCEYFNPEESIKLNAN